VIIYRLRPLLLSPVAAAWKQVKPTQVGHCGPHEGQAVSEHLENPVPLAADVERRLFDATSLGVPREGEVLIVIAVTVERPPKAGPLKLTDVVVDISVGEPGRQGIRIGDAQHDWVAGPLVRGPGLGRRAAAPGVKEASQPPAHVRFKFDLRDAFCLERVQVREPILARVDDLNDLPQRLPGGCRCRGLTGQRRPAPGRDERGPWSRQWARPGRSR
jgi:hypothetical protein